MSDEEFEIIETQLRVSAVTGDSIKDSPRLRLDIEGQAVVIMALAELSLTALQVIGGQIDKATDQDGNALQIGPMKIDPLSGDDPVEE